jgi:5-methylcytosine-specific restriction endonuclease McrA
MRNFAIRPQLQPSAERWLSTKTQVITNSQTPKETAESVYSNSRKTQWFLTSVVATLGELAGTGQPCMFCGSSEASQVDHFKPKADFPHIAMSWENFIWICGVCNQHKGNTFPFDFHVGQLLINPLDEDIWLFYTIDKYGYILAKWNVVENDIDLRAKTTEDIYKFNRQAIQESRQKQIMSLEEHVNDSILLDKFGHLSMQEKRKRLTDWLAHSFHPEVAQYFFLGPGKTEEPFATFLNLLGPNLAAA